MSGVSEKGRDCALFENGYSKGVIQCKKYEKNLSKDEFGKEITKFFLYSLLENKILPNPDTFFYYIAVSKGFVGECSDFIDSFSHEVISEPSLENWINFNMTKYVTLAPLKLQLNETLQKARNVLSRISVQKIIPSDLDRYLNNENSRYLNSLFFDVRTVVDNSQIKELQQQINELLSGKQINVEKLNIELSRGSISLRSERNEFSEIPDSHIEREETERLFNWVNGELKKDKFGKVLNFCLLAGNAGMGKTVILKDLYDRLVDSQIATLGLKADKLASSSVKELQDKIGLSLPVYEFIEICKQKFKTTVLVIDQIDALSQSMSSDRSYLQVFKDLVDQYLYDENVRIIVSVRIFDLHYDPSLRLYKDIESITVKPLTESQVFQQVGKLGIDKTMVTDKLLNLLKIPNQLSVFSRIYNSNQTCLGIDTLQDMYQELWKQKINGLTRNGAIDKRLTKELLYKIANKMFSDQQIAVSELQFDEYSQELSYLESERLIKKEGYQLQFFHQSFYDFVFAKQFIENGEDLLCYIKDNGQSLLLRSAVKMMLNYLREYSSLSYEKTLANIFSDDEILFHIKHMALSSVLFHEQPTSGERDIVSAAISGSFYLCVLFFDQGKSAYWFGFALERKLLDILNSDDKKITEIKGTDPRELSYLKNAIFLFLRNAVTNDYTGAWEFVLGFNDYSYIRNIFSTISNWDNPLSYQAFERCKNLVDIDPYRYYDIIDNIARVNTKYALEKLAQHLESKPPNKNSARDYKELDVLKTLAEKAPEKLFPLLFDIVSNELNQIISEKHFVVDYQYMRIDLHDTETRTANNYLFRLLGLCLKRSATIGAPEFGDFFKMHKSSKHKPILKLLIFAFRSNEERYPDQIYQLTVYLLALNDLQYDSTLGVENRIVFEKAFLFFSDQQKMDCIQLIKQIVSKHEISFRRKTDTEKAWIYSSWGITKYSWIKRLPITTILQDKDLKTAYQELNRRFPNFIDKEGTERVTASISRSPLSKNAYKFMNKEQWLSSFKKYDGTIGCFQRQSTKGDINEHSTAFKEIVKIDPSPEKLEIIKAALADPKVMPIYPIQGIWGWSENGSDPDSVIPLFSKILAIAKNKSLRYYCLHIAKELMGREKEDDTIINFLIDAALDFGSEEAIEIEDEKETSINNLVTKGINKFSGFAASCLVYIKDKTYENKVFDILQKILTIGPDYSRATVLFKFAYLMNVDPTRAFKIFKEALIGEHDVHVLASSIWSLQYMGNYDFEQLKTIYERLVLAKNLGRDDSQWLFTILYDSYLFDKTGADELLYKLVADNKYASLSAINEIMENYYTIEGTKHKNDQLLNFVLEKLTEEDFDHISWTFANSLHLKLIDIKHFLEKYIESPYFTINDSFIEYLTFQCNHYPLDAVELFNRALARNKFRKTDHTGIHSSESGTKFIVSAFNSLVKNDQASGSVRMKLIIAFDNVLKDFRFKTDTERVLENLV